MPGRHRSAQQSLAARPALRRASAGGLLALACASPLLLAGTALAAVTQVSSTLPASSHGWAGRSLGAQLSSGPAAPLTAVTGAVPAAVEASAPDVPAGDLAIAGGFATDGEPGRESYLRWDLAGLTPGAVVDTFAVTLLPDATYQAGYGLQSAPSLQACPVTGAAPTTDGVDWSVRPPSDCSRAVTADFDPALGTAGGWRFELAPLARMWLAGGLANEGVALRPAAGYGLSGGDAPFDLAVSGGPGLAAALTTSLREVTLAADPGAAAVGRPETTAGLPEATPVTAVVAAAAPVTSGTVTTPATVDLATTSVGAPTSLPVGPLEAYAAPAPAVAPQGTRVLRPAGVLRPLVSAQGAVPVFWLAVSGGAALLVAVSWVTGAQGPAAVPQLRRA